MAKAKSKEREAREPPIIFSGESVRAILDGKKTVTRRVVNPQPRPEEFARTIECDWYSPIVVRRGEQCPGPDTFGFWGDDEDWKCPYGAPGDRLYVKEAWCLKCDEHDIPVYNAEGNRDSSCCHFEADGYYVRAIDGDGFTRYRKNGCEASPWQSPIFMPKWASRLWLDVTAVRVERLQEITEQDAIAEGVRFGTHKPNECRTCARGAFMDTWNALNSKRGFPWESNPFVWVVEFRRSPDGR